MKLALFLLFSLFCLNAQGSEYTRDYIRIIGSSSLYPFITVAAEKFGASNEHTPVVEATGTGGGFHLLCAGNNSLRYPDIIAASRPITLLEKKLCAKHGIRHLKLVELGYGGIAIAKVKHSAINSLTTTQLYLALARYIPFKGKMIENFYQTWQEIDPSLPNYRIEVYGPSSNSGTRDILIEKIFPKANKQGIREDGAYIEMPEDYNLVIQKLIHNDQAIGVIGFNFLSENPEIAPIAINGLMPTKQTIVTEQYPLTRALLLYVNEDHLKLVPGLAAFIKAITAKDAIGEDGYLSELGLITMPAKK